MALDAMYATTAAWEGAYLGGATPLKRGHLTMSADGGLVSTPLGAFADLDELSEGLGGGFMIVPFLTRIICHVDHVVVHVIRPVDRGPDPVGDALVRQRSRRGWCRLRRRTS
jgi:Rieske 2Fe-2S family protein